MVLEQTPVDDVTRHDVEEGQRHKHRDTWPEDAGHDDDQVETGCLFVHFQLEVGHLLVHGFLQDATLLVLEGVPAAATTFKEDVWAPQTYSVEEDVVCEDGRDVAVPDSSKVGVKWEVLDFEEVSNPRRDDCQEGHITGRSEAKDVGVDEYGYEQRVEGEEECQDGSLILESGWEGSRSHEVDELFRDKTEKNVGDWGGDDDCVLDCLLYINVLEIVIASCLDGWISKRTNQVSVAVTL